MFEGATSAPALDKPFTRNSRKGNSARRSSAHHGNDLALLPSGPDAIRRPEIAEVPGRTLSFSYFHGVRPERRRSPCAACAVHGHMCAPIWPSIEPICKSFTQNRLSSRGRGMGLAQGQVPMIHFPPSDRGQTELFGE